ncbi:MAG: hypothetical protein ACRETX_05520, partial [Steroidobacteraceae bacterium]
MKHRMRPHWPILARSRNAPEGESNVSRLTFAVLDEYATEGESRGYDPYDTNDTNDTNDTGRSRRKDQV